MVKIIGLIIGGLILASGIYYLSKEKDDPESKKIYSIFSIIGIFIIVICFIFF